MNSIKIFFVISLVFCFFFSCKDNFDCEDGTGATISETRTVDAFHSLSLGIPAKVFITQGPVQELRIEAQQNVLQELSTFVVNQLLDIGLRKCLRRFSEVKIYITAPDIRALEIRGSGEVYGVNSWQVNELKLSILGSGKYQVKANGTKMTGRIEGSGSLELEGNFSTHQTKIIGSGSTKAFSLGADLVEAEIEGSGLIEIFAKNTLRAKITGSGEIRYKGTPQVESEVSGTGKVVNAN